MPAGNVKITSARRQIPETLTHPNSASRSRLTTPFGSELADIGDHITGNGRSADGKYSARSRVPDCLPLSSLCVASQACGTADYLRQLKRS